MLKGSREISLFLSFEPDWMSVLPENELDLDEN